jgi:hypothetical protein
VFVLLPKEPPISRLSFNTGGGPESFRSFLNSKDQAALGLSARLYCLILALLVLLNLFRMI